MKKFTSLFCVSIFSFSTVLTFAGNKCEVIIPGQDPSKKQFVMAKGLVDGEDYLSKTIIFRVKPNYRQNCKVNSVDNILPLQDFLNSIEAQNLAKIYPRHEKPEQERNALGQKLVDLSLIYSFKYTADMKLEKVINQMKSLGYFEYVEPWYVPKLHAVCIPNDLGTSAQYHLQGNVAGSINVRNTAFCTQNGSTSVVIGITDTGTELNHPDLAANIAHNNADGPTVNGVDDDGDGYIDNYQGWDVGMNDRDPTWQGDAHGVATSGDACAVTNNGTGVASPGFNCKFLPVKIADASGALVAAYTGITYAADHGVKIISNSWGGTGGGSYGQNIIDYAAINKNCLVLASAGNGGVEESLYPSSYNNVYRVASTTSSDAKSGFSSYGLDVDFGAPGSSIYSTYSGGSYSTLSGTSMACPVSAGAAGLVQSQFNYTNAFQIGEKLKQTCDPYVGASTLALYNAGKLGKGRIDVNSALTVTAKSLAMNPITITDGNDDVLLPGENLSIRGRFTNYLDPSSSSATATLTVVSGPGTITSGNPFIIGVLPTLDTTNNNSSPFIVNISGSAAVNSVIQFKVTITDGTFTGIQYFSVTVNVDYINITINDVHTTITSKGRLGYNLDGQAQGLGFEYQIPSPNSLLYEMSLMVGTSSTKVDDMFRETTSGNTDFASTNRVYQVTPATVSDFDVDGKFNDAPSASGPLPVTVHHSAYAWSTSPYRKFVIVKYVIKNTGGSTLNNLYAGIVADWDITNAGQNKSAYDATNKMGYCYDVSSANGLYSGIKCLTNLASVKNYCIDNIAGGNGGIDPATDFLVGEKYTALSTTRNADGFSATGGDVMDCVSNGPFSVNAGDSITVAFALIGGDNLADIQNSACYAQQKWNNTGPCSLPLSATTSYGNVSCYGQCNGTGTANVSGGALPYTYLWNNAQTNQTATGLCAGTYTITVTDAVSATTTAAVTISQPSVLNVTANSPSPICSGNCTTLTANATGGNGGNNYVWQPGNMTTTSVSVCPTALTNYTATVTDANGCTATTTTTVSMNPPQATPVITANGSTTICQGNNVTLSSSAGNSYVWSTGATTQDITVSVAGNYSVTVTNAGGCSATSTVTNITVLSTTASITPSGLTTFCMGNDVTLTANSGSSYLWSNNATTQSIVVNQSGSFTVAVTNQCGADTSTLVSVTVNSLPAVSVSLNPDSLCINASAYALTGGTPGGGTYSGNGVSAGNFDPNIAGGGLHNIIYTYTDGNNCSNSDTAQIYVDLCTGIQSISENQSIIIFPNPTTGEFTVYGLQFMVESKLQITNALGEKMYSEKILNPKPVVSGAEPSLILNLDLPNGIYFIHLVSEKTGEAVMTKKFAVVK
ncbi:MAG: S8 family serine peptidase [Bacteroidetes bacterium]|nr:S8 family serine peptidase [Bacteroidota bacterium]